MSFQKLAAWLLTDKGKHFSFIAAGTATTATLVATFLPHTILLEQYKNLVHLYKNGLSVALTPVLQDRFQKTLKLLEVKPIDYHLYKPFFSYGFEVISAGSSYSRFGVIVGLPINFSYSSPEMVDRSKIKIMQESIVWDSEIGQQLLNSLFLSENAQLYAMAREIKYRQTGKPMFDVLLSTAACGVTYGVSHHLNQKFNLYAKPLGVRLVVYTLVGLFMIGSYTMSKDMTQMYYEESIDKELKERSTIFAEGGKEYYTKLLERNKALRHLLGKEGERLYSILGNENYFLRNKHLPLVHRKLIFEDNEPVISEFFEQ
ncbi:unnamed protein product [Phaedon cochleariae]|uniref:Transmembrane protein 177 n=1 Tax=Phaedon cochleariae TaxID=80249 RepID=A0A9N9X7W0_PHACE|nr:unnamed protein product [Phaedon cochleariae]